MTVATNYEDFKLILVSFLGAGRGGTVLDWGNSVWSKTVNTWILNKLF